MNSDKAEYRVRNRYLNINLNLLFFTAQIPYAEITAHRQLHQNLQNIHK